MPGQFPTLSTGSSFRYPVDREINLRSVTYRFCDFSEQSYLKGNPALSPVVFDFTWARISTADKDTIRAFYRAQNGSEATDWSLYFDNTMYLNCQFVGEFNPQYVDTNIWNLTLRVRTTPGGNTSVIPFPHGLVVSGLAHLTTAHAPNATSAQWGGGAGFNDVLALFSPHPTWIEDPSTWAKRTDTRALSSTEIGNLVSGALYLLLAQYHVGSGVGPYDPPDEFLIYDAWIDVVYEDGTTGTWRPTATSVSGTVTNPGDAVDTDPNTFATVAASGYGLALDGSFLNLHGWRSAT